MNQEKDKGKAIKIRLDISFRDGEPILEGVALGPWGWILGGHESGDLVIRTQVDLSGKADEIAADTRRGATARLGRLRRLLREYDYNFLRRNYLTRRDFQ